MGPLRAWSGVGVSTTETETEVEEEDDVEEPAEVTQAAAQPAPMPTPAPECSPPAGTFEKAVALGAAKANMPAAQVFVMGLAGGVYIGFGGLLMFCVGCLCPGIVSADPGMARMVAGAFGFPMGLLMALVCGAELYPANTALVTAAVAEGKASLRDLFRSCVCAYLGNLVGALLLVSFVSASDLLVGSPAPAAVAVAKTSQTWIAAFFRGILCNWLVCNAVWAATAATSLPGKFIGIFGPISGFVAMGMENSVANMFMIPMGIACGANISWSHFLTANLIPVTLGNFVSGAIFMGLYHCLLFGKLGAPLRATKA